MSIILLNFFLLTETKSNFNWQIRFFRIQFALSTRLNQASVLVSVELQLTFESSLVSTLFCICMWLDFGLTLVRIRHILAGTFEFNSSQICQLRSLLCLSHSSRLQLCFKSNFGLLTLKTLNKTVPFPLRKLQKKSTL